MTLPMRYVPHSLVVTLTDDQVMTAQFDVVQLTHDELYQRIMEEPFSMNSTHIARMLNLAAPRPWRIHKYGAILDANDKIIFTSDSYPDPALAALVVTAANCLDHLLIEVGSGNPRRTASMATVHDDTISAFNQALAAASSATDNRRKAVEDSSFDSIESS